MAETSATVFLQLACGHERPQLLFRGSKPSAGGLPGRLAFAKRQRMENADRLHRGSFALPVRGKQRKCRKVIGLADRLEQLLESMQSRRPEFRPKQCHQFHGSAGRKLFRPVLQLCRRLGVLLDFNPEQRQRGLVQESAIRPR